MESERVWPPSGSSLTKVAAGSRRRILADPSFPAGLRAASHPVRTGVLEPSCTLLPSAVYVDNNKHNRTLFSLAGGATPTAWGVGSVLYGGAACARTYEIREHERSRCLGHLSVAVHTQFSCKLNLK